ncbi:hypothetical protein OUZ56_013082 [Daphnia magna]|uniref:G-patch domain-containing protein n=1 Tax=Daphnia magna TaxID=35525 RepID=A0ABQ9Z4U1_9CRUS|nr:hypothetical protein OUZ56_013081 [Daphnia magna]KAK4007921.1 hypothetical protein OUZ56_013082 [Daphnia magna]
MSQRGVYELAFPILEKTHYQMIITDTICISIDHFIALEEDIRQARTENSVRTTITKDVMEGNYLSTNSAFEVLSKEESIAVQPVNCAAAMKMMKKMGWSEGTGLGAKKQGIVEPSEGNERKGEQNVLHFSHMQGIAFLSAFSNREGYGVSITDFETKKKIRPLSVTFILLRSLQ